MKYSLRSLMIAVALAPPALAVLWGLRDTWLVQVSIILALMVAALCIGCWLISALIAATHQLARLLPNSSAPKCRLSLRGGAVHWPQEEPGHVQVHDP